MRKKLFITLLFTFLICCSYAEGTKIGQGWFRYAQFGHSTYADVHPFNVRIDIAESSNKPIIDYDRTGKSFRLLTAGLFGANLPIWSGDIVDERFGLAVNYRMSSNMWMDFFQPSTSAVLTTDFRIDAIPTLTFIHRVQKGFLNNYSFSCTPFRHESTHAGDEITLQREDMGYGLRRVNVSYHYTQMEFTINEDEDRIAENHLFRLGLIVRFWPGKEYWGKQGSWYQVIGCADGDWDLCRPKHNPWELWLQYQYQSKTHKTGWQAIVSVEVRNRCQYGYNLYAQKGNPEYQNADGTWKESAFQEEKRVFTYSAFIGVRYNIPGYDGCFSRFAMGIRAYHGNCPWGQYRSLGNYSQIGLSLIFE